MASSVRPGDVVRFGRGRTEWQVESVGAFGATCVSLSSGRRQTHQVASLRVARTGQAATTDPSAEYRVLKDGATMIDGELVRCSDALVHTTTEWRWPRYGQPDPSDGIRPRGVSAIVCQADDDGERWLEVELTGTLSDRGGVSLRREAAAELGVALLHMANKLGGGYTPGR